MELLREVILVDQSPIGRTPRSNPVTYIKAFDIIRDIFASTPDAKKRGYNGGHFSFNIPGGRCENCQGDGTVTVEMQFLADVELVCEECKGTRFKSSILDIRYKGLNIHEVLQLTVKEALSFFSESKRLVTKLQVLADVGLGYLRLGQSATTLSGGEAQRVKLAAHLAQATCDGALYIFDEPTTGLHFDDISKLLTAFQRLIDNGGSILIIEHNLDVIRSADWVIDLGPEGGDRRRRSCSGGNAGTNRGRAGFVYGAVFERARRERCGVSRTGPCPVSAKLGQGGMHLSFERTNVPARFPQPDLCSETRGALWLPQESALRFFKRRTKQSALPPTHGGASPLDRPWWPERRGYRWPVW